MTMAPATTPTMSATCCRHGVASTNCPVFRSCKLSLEMVAAQNTTDVTNKAYATRAGPAELGRNGFTTNTKAKAAPRTTRMPTPDRGLLDAPISPAM